MAGRMSDPSSDTETGIQIPGRICRAMQVILISQKLSTHLYFLKQVSKTKYNLVF